MFLHANSMQQFPRLTRHFDDLWAKRAMFANSQSILRANYQQSMDENTLRCNAFDGAASGFWQEIDASIIEMRDQETGMEIVNDLLRVQTVLPIGKTAKLYSFVGDIADDVSVSIDGQAPYSLDHTEYGSDGDPIPVFTAGFGVNWRLAEGLNTVGFDLVMDSQRAKTRKFYKKLVNYVLNGDSKIRVDAYPGQGIKNHRNTKKINLGTGTGGVNIDLTTATQAELVAFFTTGAFGSVAMANRVDAYDRLVVSKEIERNLTKAATVTIGGSEIISDRRVLDVIMPFMPVREVVGSYALSGNEFIAYQRRRDVISPLVGMSVGVVPIPRMMPQENYNFQIMAAMGIQISKDADGRSGVVYGADLD